MKRYLTSAFVLFSAASPLSAESAEESGDPFEVKVSTIDQGFTSVYYRGLPLDAQNPSSKYSDGREALATASEFPNALSCLSFEAETETVSLANLDTGKFEKMADLEICLQKVGNEIGDLSKFEPWLRAVGFGWTDERPASHWLSARVWTQFTQHLIAKMWTIDRKFRLSFFVSGCQPAHVLHSAKEAFYKVSLRINVGVMRDVDAGV
nr:hypothetical protein [Aquicoccus sp. G2-2]MEA1111942.1 hypothetical protein [Aquicoccus sp. G2-2]